MTLEPLTLKEAAKRYRMKLATLRMRVKDGSLVAYRPGREFLTTAADVEAMIKKCRVQPAHTYTSTAPGTHGASETVLNQDELDAVLLTRLAPKRSSLNTSPASIDRRRRLALASGT